MSTGFETDVQPPGFARVGALDTQTACVRDDRDVPAVRDRLVHEERGDVEHLLERVRSDHAVLTEDRVHRGVVGCEQRSRVRRGCTGPGHTAPTLHGDDRLALADPLRVLREALRVPERLEVEEHDRGARVFVPVGEEVVARDIRLVADADERR
jgi:hypothetical protein